MFNGRGASRECGTPCHGSAVRGQRPWVHGTLTSWDAYPGSSASGTRNALERGREAGHHRAQQTRAGWVILCLDVCFATHRYGARGQRLDQLTGFARVWIALRALAHRESISCGSNGAFAGRASGGQSRRNQRTAPGCCWRDPANSTIGRTPTTQGRQRLDMNW